ncbi:MAG TPA: GDSL family lipase, partial [Rubrivivax sp.]|nr:GDSL family lipase [Rubrivivax sp.]
MRVRLSNRYGTSTLVVQAAWVSRGNGIANAVGGSGGELRFGGRTSFTIPAFSEIISDWIVFPVPSLSDLAIDIYIASDTSAGTSPLTIANLRPTGEIGSYLAPGNQVGAATFSADVGRPSWYFLTVVDVSSGSAPGTVVCFGDSITHGSASTFYADQRYPDFLAERVIYGGQIAPMGV